MSFFLHVNDLFRLSTISLGEKGRRKWEVRLWEIFTAHTRAHYEHLSLEDLKTSSNWDPQFFWKGQGCGTLRVFLCSVPFACLPLGTCRSYILTHHIPSRSRNRWQSSLLNQQRDYGGNLIGLQISNLISVKMFYPGDTWYPTLSPPNQLF